MSWLRLDEHLPDNAKAQLLSAPTFKLWINLLCICKSTEGRLPPVDELAFRLRCSPAVVSASLHELTNRGFLDIADKDTFIHDWDRWQYRSDVSTDRVKRFRETAKKRDETVSRNGDCNAPEQIQNRTETEQMQKNLKSTPCASEPDARLDLTPFETTDGPQQWFNVWWVGYWLHKGKKQARSAFLRIMRNAHQGAYALFQRILEETRRQKAEMLSRDPIHRPHGATWLNGERWNDEHTEQRLTSGQRAVLRDIEQQIKPC
jgi:hypothetical protein